MCPRFNPLGLENLCANLNVSNQHCENGYTEKRFNAEQITFASCTLALRGQNAESTASSQQLLGDTSIGPSHVTGQRPSGPTPYKLSCAYLLFWMPISREVNSHVS